LGELTAADEQLLPAALRANQGFALACQWYLRDWVPLPGQWAFHQFLIDNFTNLGGIACGKTSGVAASYGIDCLSIPYFRALNCSITAVQAELPFAMFMGWADSNPRLEHLIDDVQLRPFPKITFKNFSEWEFRTAGKDARFIRGFEFDRINYDEGGLDYEGEAMKVLRGRLRGKRIDGTTRMARLDVTTSPTDAPWLAERFYRGVKDHQTANLKLYRSMRQTVYDNIHLTRDQIAAMEAEYSDEMIDVELRGLFPDYGMTTFPSSSIEACTEQAQNDEMEMATRPETGKPRAGWRVEEHPRHGIVHFEVPPVPQGRYVQAGDPGLGDPPKRNAAVVMVFRTDVKPYDLVYFDWVFGKGSYNPFLASFKYAIDLYQPVMRGLDATGTQKAIEELAFENVGIVVDGLNFTRDKEAMVNALSIAITNHHFRWPLIKGLNSQLRHYRREEDKKLAQDLVMTLAEVAFLTRHLPEEVQAAVRNVHNGGFAPRRARTAYTSRRHRR